MDGSTLFVLRVKQLFGWFLLTYFNKFMILAVKNFD